MFEINKLPGSIDIGYTGETNFRPVQIDMSAWMTKMPAGVPSIVHIRPFETAADAYIANTTFENNILTWMITAGDLGETEGEGLAQIWLEEEDDGTITKRGKSVNVKTVVHQSANEPDENPPEAQGAWLEAMTALKVATVNAAEDAEDAKDDAVTAKEAAEDARDAAQAAAGDFQGLTASVSGLAAGTDPTVTVTHSQGGLYNMAFGIPKGDKGDKGDNATDAQVAAYLATVVTNPDSPPLDRTLSSSVSAAPADMVGDLKSAISDDDDNIIRSVDLRNVVNNRIQKDLYGNYQVFPVWHRGAYETNGYSALTSLKYLYSDILPAGSYIITPESGYYVTVFTYVSDVSGTELYSWGGNALTFTAESPFVVSSRKNPFADISTSEIEDYNSKINIKFVVSESGIANDVQTAKTNIHNLTDDAILMDGLMFFYYTQRPTITRNSDRSFTVVVPVNPRGIYVKNGKIVPVADTITSETYNVPSSSYFVYNITTSLFAVMTYQQINASSDEIILLFHNQNGYLYGQWERFTLEDSISNAIIECKAYADNMAGHAALPSYYESYMPGKLATIRERIANAGNRGVSFAFISDIHYDLDKQNNMRKSALLLKEISNKTSVKMMICGGDMITLASGSKDAGIQLEQEVITDFRTRTQMDTFWALGNHEYNNPGNDPALISQQLSRSEIYPTITQGNCRFITLSDSSGAYYVDDLKNKVRFLYSACTSDSQVETGAITWLIETMPSVPTDFDIVLISHLGIYYNPSSAVYTGPVDAFKPILQALQAYKGHTTYTYDGQTYDFSSKTGTVLGAFLGHYHVDGQGVWNTIPCAIITTDSLNQRPGTLTRTAGTTTEQAFDVVTIDRTNSKIYCTRIGAGLDRTFENGEWTVES